MLKHFIIILLMILSSVKIIVAENLTVGVTNAPPFIIIDNDNISGLTIDLWDNISDSLNVDYQFVETDIDNVVTNIKEGEINISIAPMAVNSTHAEMNFYSQPFYINVPIVKFISKSKPMVLRKESEKRFFMIVTNPDS